jgi:uncharacterized protein (TIGR02594 family)
MEIYRVRSGDTLGKIAKFYGISLNRLLGINPQIVNKNKIFVGQVINVPERQTEPGASIHREAVGDSPAAWFAIAMREMETGVDEVAGPEHNPRIVEYHQSTSLKATDDETPWCSSFVNWCMEQAGEDKTNSAMALSWLKWGEELAEPRKGCVAVFSRGNIPTAGHVGFYVDEINERILLLGGNQSNQININSYPKSSLLGYRWPKATIDRKPSETGAITAAQLGQIMPHASKSNISKYLDPLNKTMQNYEINTPLRQAHFIAQLAHESGSFRYSEEIASGSAYEGRRDLGNTQPGDGRKFKGRGLIQLTGRSNYQEYGRDIGRNLLEDPELVATDSELCVDVAGWYWMKREINLYADANDIKMVTRKINGGLNGLIDRIDYFERAQHVLI